MIIAAFNSLTIFDILSCFPCNPFTLLPTITKNSFLEFDFDFCPPPLLVYFLLIFLLADFSLGVEIPPLDTRILGLKNPVCSDSRDSEGLDSVLDSNI